MHFSSGLAPHSPQASPSVFKKGLWLAQVPEKFPFFLRRILIPIPTNTNTKNTIVTKKTGMKLILNILMQNYYI